MNTRPHPLDFAAWRAAFRGSWQVNGTFLLAHLVAATIVCLFMAWLGRRVGWGALYFYTDFREHERYDGLMTLVSAGALAFGAWSLLLVGRPRRGRWCRRCCPSPARRHAIASGGTP